MPKQTILWTILPNGVTGAGANQRLRLSVVVSPRLEAAVAEGDTLGLFPDFLDWPVTVAGVTFRVEFGGGTSIAATPAAPSPLEPALWKALFKPDTFVRPYRYDPKRFDQSLIISYPVARTLTSLKEVYQRVGLEYPGQVPQEPSEGRIPGVADFRVGWDRQAQARLREQLRAEQSQTGPVGVAAGAGLSREQLFQRAMLFHKIPVPGATPPAPPAPLPQTAGEFERYVDVHQTLSSLDEYPAIMRRLGLVIDLEVPAADVPTAPTAGRLRVLPSWQPDSSVASADTRPWTAYIWDGARFAAEERGGVADGLLPLSDAVYDLVQVDVDGAVLKAANFSSSMDLAGDEAPDQAGLPSLRTGGVSVTVDGRAAGVHGRLEEMRRRNQAAEAGRDVALFAEDLVKGYAIDVWDSASGAWHSLCRRVGTYDFVGAGITRTIEDEGFVQLGVTQDADGPPSPSAPDLYLHESLFRWEGWSLVAPRPDKALNRSGDPEQALDDDPTANEPITPFKLVTTFKAAKRSLPRLRFGLHYRVRARAVDLAGNRLPLESAPDAALPEGKTGFSYRRFEPVPPPVVALRHKLTEQGTPGESLERIVVRSRNNSPAKDGVVNPDASERNIAPPRASELLCEVHGRFDAASGRLKTDAATYNLIRDRDAAPFPPDQSPSGNIVTPAKLNIPYLPDPLARGAAFRGLPGAPDGTLGTIDGGGGLGFTPLPDLKVRDGSAALIDFGPPSDWPKARPFRLIFREGSDAPTWNKNDRILAVELPKAEVATIQVSSYVFKDDLKLLGVWEWLREYIERRSQELIAANDPWSLERLARDVATCAQYAEEGGHWMLTPARPLTLVHAVQQPLGVPRALAMIASRTPGSTHARLFGALDIHFKSTEKVELPAEWEEPVDAPGDPAGPATLSGAGQAGEVQLTEPGFDGTIRNNGVPVASYQEPTGHLLFAPNAHPTHEFGDTKHRMVRYRVVASSRFREYFPPDAPGGFSRTSEEILVSVPSSARPDLPHLEYVLPAYGWRRQTDTNLIASQRLGGGLRVYLGRPWYSSGEGELLGVVLFSGIVPDERREELKPYVSMWGIDPIRLGERVFGQPQAFNFTEYARTGEDLALPELPQASDRVDVVGYRPQYDAERGLWYCDIQIEPGDAYYPFVRLALARYQPSSIPGAALSRVVVADFVQLAADRSLIVTYDPYNRDRLHVVVAGVSYRAIAAPGGAQEPGGSVAEVSVETRRADVAGELGWMPAPAGTASVVAAQQVAEQNVLWRGHVTLPAGRTPGQFRLVVKEFERLYGDGSPFVGPARQARLVYADTVDV